MIYVKNKKIVDALGKATDPPVIDCENAPEIEFQLLDAAGEAVAPEAGETYTFNGATAFYGKNVIFTADCTPEAGDETLVFKPDTYNSDYIREVAYKGQSIDIQIHKGGDGGPIIMDGKALANPRIANPAQPPAPIAEYYTVAQTDEAIEAAIADLPAPITAHSGLSGRTDADQHPIEAITGLADALAAGGEGSSFYPPVANYLVNDATYGAVYYLDSLIPSIVFAERVLNLKKVRLRMVSANPAVTGNIVIVPAVDGVDQAPVTLAVGSAASTVDVEVSAAVTGRFSLRRDYAAAADTLDDVTAIVTALRILEV